MPQRIRMPAVAGYFYPASPATLQSTVTALLDAAPRFELHGLRALIAPHAGYRYSGAIAATAFKQLESMQPPCDTVLLLGPAHRVAVDGVAAGTFEAMETPLGRVPVDVVGQSLLLAKGRPFVRHDAAHEPEHCLEVELPFLQRLLPAVRVIPLLLGDTDPMPVAGHLLELMHQRSTTLLVVSSDLSHYYPYDEAVRRDRALLDGLLAGSATAVSRQQACGMHAILTLMALAQQLGWQPHLLDYRNSGDTAGGKDAVVGYAAVAYTAG